MSKTKTPTLFTEEEAREVLTDERDELRLDVEALHLMCQGVKHYSQCHNGDCMRCERDALKAQNADLKHDIACLESKIGVERRAGEAAISELERLRDLIGAVKSQYATPDIKAEARAIRAAREGKK